MADVSRTTVLILLIITVLVSVLGVFTVFQATTNGVPVVIKSSSNSAAPPDNPPAPGVHIPEDDASISLEIAPRPAGE